MIRAAVVICLGLAATAAQALDLTLPSNARVTEEQVSEPDSYRLPTGPFAAGTLPARILEGKVLRRAWRIDSQDLTTLQLLAPLRAQLEEAGYSPLFECADAACGGYDFRFEIDVLPAPAMHVSLADFRFLAAGKGTDDHIGLLVSRSGNAGFIQLVRVTEADADAQEMQVTLSGPPSAATSSDGRDLATRLSGQGFVILRDLEFATGSSELGDGRYASLAALAAYMNAQPNARIALVGHTDTVGTLEGNIALSKRRAASVLERLAGVYEVPRDRMEAEGMGYLSPVAPNTTPEGREANRRVEVVLLNTE